MQVKSEIISVGTKKSYKMKRFYKILHGKGGELN